MPASRRARNRARKSSRTASSRIATWPVCSRTSPMRAALFDMDRTLVRKETASLYVRYQRELGAATWRDQARVLWWVSQYTLGVIDAHEVAARVASDFAGLHETVLSARCDDWCRR